MYYVVIFFLENMYGGEMCVVQELYEQPSYIRKEVLAI